ncbi:MAG: hypothetical protein OXN89_13565 [Bryobacterales bacterium]|nr:hypothetical protein [Bryobacterales bacterium]
MAIGRERRAVEHLASAIRELHQSDVDAQRRRVEDPGLVWARAQASLRLSARRPSRFPLMAQCVAAVAVAAILGICWGDATAGVAGLLRDCGAGLNRYWESRVSEILVAAPVALVRTLLP